MGIEVAFVERGRPVPWEQPARRGEDEERNPIPLLAQSWLILEPGGSAGAFFHLKPKLVPFVPLGARALCLAGQQQLPAGLAKQFPTSVPFATSFLPISPV